MFLEELAKDFEEHGPEVIRPARIERPVEYLKIIAVTLPKEFEITDSRLEEISDGEPWPLPWHKADMTMSLSDVRFWG